MNKPKYLNLGQLASKIDVSRQYLYQVFNRKKITEKERRILKKLTILIESDRKLIEKKIKNSLIDG